MEMQNDNNAKGASSTEDSVSEEEKESSDGRHLTLPKNTGFESDDEWEVIKIEDDSDGDSRKRDTPTDMVCLRCPNKTAGSFKDKEKFWMHIKRHTFGNHFTCRTCRRPFVKFNHCISHEIRVHGTKLEYEYDNRDSVISMAKAYVRKKELTKKNATTEPNTQQKNLETDVETDCENSKFYDNQVVSSTSLYPYRGPEVKSILESYEIQINHARQKNTRSNLVARIALEVHDQNVELGNSTLTLGRFSTSKKKPAKNNCKRKKNASNVRPSDKRQAESAIEKSEQPKQKRRKVVYQYITSSSSSPSSSSEDDNVDDVDYEPSRDKSRRYESDCNSKDIKANGNSSQNKVRKRRAPANLSRPKFRFLSGIMKRVCQKCNYMWKDEADLRIHRDTRHPNLPLMDLMEVHRIKPKSSKKARKVGDSSGLASKKNHDGQEMSSSTVGEAGTNVVAAGPSGQNRNGKRVVENIANASNRVGLEGLSVKIGNKGSKNKLRTNTSNAKDSRKKANEKKKKKPKSKRMQLVPVPDSTFTEKEKFLHVLGLTNRIRLELFRKKPIKDLKLPECYVELERLNPQLSKSNFKLWFEKPLWELVTWDDDDFVSSK